MRACCLLAVLTLTLFAQEASTVRATSLACKIATGSSAVALAAEPACPSGYRVVKNDATGLVCAASGDTKDYCPEKSFVYLGGPDGKTCLSLNQDNPCMRGFYACEAGSWGTGKKSCCAR
jgi:hypothetical protein